MLGLIASLKLRTFSVDVTACKNPFGAPKLDVDRFVSVISKIKSAHDSVVMALNAVDTVLILIYI